MRFSIVIFISPDGLPKVHEHDKKPPQAFALFDEQRMILLYTYESDLGDGWEDPNVHKNPWIVRESALKMGVNIIFFCPKPVMSIKEHIQNFRSQFLNIFYMGI